MNATAENETSTAKPVLQAKPPIQKQIDNNP
jgi:hypothetical protein